MEHEALPTLQHLPLQSMRDLQKRVRSGQNKVKRRSRCSVIRAEKWEMGFGDGLSHLQRKPCHQIIAAAALERSNSTKIGTAPTSLALHSWVLSMLLRHIQQRRPK